MFSPRPCGCKGIRTCLLCEEKLGAVKKESGVHKEAGNCYVFCPLCEKAWPGWDGDLYKQHPNHSGEPIDYPGIYIKLDFLTAEEELHLICGCDEMPWFPSQSGRRKQNFGPKCNFKKKKVQPDSFNGFPAFSKFVQDKFKEVPLLKNYFTVEQCSLEYLPERGSSIDSHIDDCWIWGERIVSVNLCSDCVLTMTKYKGTKDKFNLHDVDTYSPIIQEDRNGVNYVRVDDNCTDKLCDETYYKQSSNCGKEPAVLETTTVTSGGLWGEETVVRETRTMSSAADSVIIRIPMPRRSLLLIYGSSRYDWEHCVLREDVTERRVCLAYRELTPPYLQGGQYWSVGRVILQKAQLFWEHQRKEGDTIESKITQIVDSETANTC